MHINHVKSLRHLPLVASAAILLGALATAPAGAAPASMVPAAPTAGADAGILQLAQSVETYSSKRGRDNRTIRRDRCRELPFGCRDRFRDGNWDNGWNDYGWGHRRHRPGVTLGFGFDLGPQYRSYGYGSAHVQWCLDRYRSYNPSTNLWLSYSGNYRQCISPYS